MAGVLEALLLRPTAEVRAAAGRADAALVDLDAAGLALLPITERLHQTVSGPNQGAEAVLGFDYLTRPVAEWAVWMSHATPVAYIHLEFHGGTGFHAAVAWGDGAIRWGPRFTANHPGEGDEQYELVPR